MQRISPTCLARTNSNGDVEALALTVISYNKKVECYELYKTKGETFATSVTVMKQFPFLLRAKQEMEEFIEEQVNNGFSLAEKTADYKINCEKENILSINPFLSNELIVDTLGQDNQYWSKSLPRGVRCCIDIDVHKGQCLVTNINGEPITISTALQLSFKESIDGYFNESVMLDAIMFERKLYIVDLISVNGRHTEFPFEARLHWLNNYKGACENIIVIPSVKVNAGTDVYNVLGNIEYRHTGLLYKANSTYVCGSPAKKIEEVWRVTTSKVVPLVVTGEHKNMLKVGFMNAHNPVTCAVLPNNGGNIDKMSVVNVTVDLINENLVFGDVLGLPDKDLTLSDCDNPYDLFGLDSPFFYAKQVKVDFCDSTGFDDLVTI